MIPQKPVVKSIPAVRSLPNDNFQLPPAVNLNAMRAAQALVALVPAEEAPAARVPNNASAMHMGAANNTTGAAAFFAAMGKASQVKPAQK